MKVTWLDRKAARAEVERAVKALVRERPEVERVILFGSLATGDAVPGSDADLIVILGDSDLPFLERIPRYMPSDCAIGVDVFPYTRAELDRMLADGNWFVRRALAEGVEIHGAVSSPPPGSSPP